MLTSPDQINAPFTNQTEDWNPVVSVPLDEPTAYETLDAYFEREADRLELASVAGIDDDDVLDALMAAGFTADTLPALELAPIAFAAWASNVVTDEESQAAIWSMHESRLFEHPGASSIVQTWLDIRPERELWALWVSYTKCRLQNLRPATRRTIGRQLLDQATSVALASGGFLGIGKVCGAEQAVLDGICNVYRL